jgi:hypothetical protein
MLKIVLTIDAKPLGSVASLLTGSVKKKIAPMCQQYGLHVLCCNKHSKLSKDAFGHLKYMYK